VRVARPGGWIELVEAPPLVFDREGPSMARFGQLALAAAAHVGIDGSDIVYRSLDTYLRDAGAERVTRHEVALPVGAWGGRVGSMMATSFRVILTSLAHVFEAACDLEPQELADLINEVQLEYDELRVSTSLAIVYGQKPG
jgi:hypothetical protein